MRLWNKNHLIGEFVTLYVKIYCLRLTNTPPKKVKCLHFLKMNKNYKQESRDVLPKSCSPQFVIILVHNFRARLADIQLNNKRVVFIFVPREIQFSPFGKP